MTFPSGRGPKISSNSVKLRSLVFASPAEFLVSKLPDVESCLVLDIRLPGATGLEFQERLARSNIHLPVIFMTGFGDVPMSVRAMKAGAIDFLLKPFRDQEMLEAIYAAIARDRDRRMDEARSSDIQLRHASLSLREKEILSFVASGLLNKQIADRVGLAEATVKVHRANVMRKMDAKSLAELVRISERLKLERER